MEIKGEKKITGDPLARELPKMAQRNPKPWGNKGNKGGKRQKRAKKRITGGPFARELPQNAPKPPTRAKIMEIKGEKKMPGTHWHENYRKTAQRNPKPWGNKGNKGRKRQKTS